jgi:hypothetical protein
MKLHKKIALFMTFFCLNACSTIKDTIGVSKPVPNEFSIKSNAPLVVPPTLDLDDDNSYMPQNTEIEEGTLNENDEKFLNYISDTQNKSRTKSAIDAEYEKNLEDHNKKGVISKKLSKLRGEINDPVVDVKAETDRINDNISNNRPINHGAVQNKSSSTIKKIFQ